jgi:L-fuculose-phosphate aldolase
VSEAEVRKEVAEICRTLYEKGYMPGVDGNISMRVDENHAIVTPSGVCKGRVKEDQLVLMSLSGEKIKGDLKPTSEAPMHMAVYALRPDVNAVIHAHSPNAVAWAMTRRPLDTRYAPFAYYHLGTVGLVPYLASGSPELHRAVADEIKTGGCAMMLASHGTMVLGADMQDAFAKADLLESYCDMLIKALALGGACVLTDKELNELHAG